MSLCVVSATLGHFDDAPRTHAPQSVPCDFYTFTDESFPPRTQAMTPRLQARIPKMTSWQMRPGYDYYLWVDSSFRLADPGAVQWFLDQLGDADLAVFRHPDRQTVQEEADYLKHRLAIGCPYITPRYAGERIDDQLAVVDPSQQLYASTAFIYKNDTPARDALAIWWMHTSLYHSIDQLSLPAAITHAGARVHVIPDNFRKVKYLEYTRKQRHD